MKTNYLNIAGCIVGVICLILWGTFWFKKGREEFKGVTSKLELIDQLEGKLQPGQYVYHFGQDFIYRGMGKSHSGEPAIILLNPRSEKEIKPKLFTSFKREDIKRVLAETPRFPVPFPFEEADKVRHTLNGWRGIVLSVGRKTATVRFEINGNFQTVSGVKAFELKETF